MTNNNFQRPVNEKLRTLVKFRYNNTDEIDVDEKIENSYINVNSNQSFES